MSVALNKQIVEDFIQQVWNERKIGNLDRFIGEDYRDHSFAPGVPPDKNGLVSWIASISTSFDHQTSIDSMTAEQDLVTVRITFTVKHTGRWRNMDASGKEAEVKGFRQFRLKNGRIVEHWALLDGERLQSTLSEGHAGCQLVKQ